MNKKIKLFDPVIDSLEEEKILEVLRSGNWASGAGKGNVKKFEENFQKYTNSDDCIAVNSGTAALNLALSLLDVKNKHVILPSMSFVSTANAVVMNGGIPVFVEIEPETMCIDPESVKKLLTKKTSAILPVHFGGMPCKLDKLNQIIKGFKCTIIEDAAHAAGTSYKKKKIGSHSFASCFSFHPVKNLAMPTGGAITINKKQHTKIRKELETKRWCGITDRKLSEYNVKDIGNNYYMNEFSAAIGLIQLKKLDRMNKQRREIAKIYCKEIDLENKMQFDQNCSYHLFWIRVKNRNKFRKILDKKKIETGTHYKAIHTFDFYQKFNKAPMTKKISEEIVTIPIHPNLKSHEIDKIVSVINSIN